MWTIVIILLYGIAAWSLAGTFYSIYKINRTQRKSRSLGRLKEYDSASGDMEANVAVAPVAVTQPILTQTNVSTEASLAIATQIARRVKSDRTPVLFINSVEARALQDFVPHLTAGGLRLSGRSGRYMLDTDLLKMAISQGAANCPDQLRGLADEAQNKSESDEKNILVTS